MNINIPVTGASLYGYGFDVSLSLDASHFIYGYGYGDFDGSDPTYFDVLSIVGDGTGYGIESLSGYNYGWGYERTQYLAGDESDSILVTATVTDNGGVPAESGIPVLFTGVPGVTFTSNLVYTDISGQATTYVKIDSTAVRNLDVFGANNPAGERPRYAGYPAFGFMSIEATIPKCMVARDWDVKIDINSTQNYGESECQLINIPVCGYGSF